MTASSGIQLEREGEEDRDRGLVVPVIDISDFAGGSAEARAAIAAQVDDAATDVGFMQIVGHGIPAEQLTALTAAMDAFFAQPLDVKNQTRPDVPEINRGYSGPKTERVSASLGVATPADLFEAFNVGSAQSDFPQVALSPTTYPENLWPAEPTGFPEAVTTWFSSVSALARELTRIFAVALGLPEDYFSPMQDHPIETMRLINYQVPRADVRIEVDQQGMGAHTDFGFVTVLWADAVPGFQILRRDGVWADVEPTPGALLINLGDLLARWTNDRWLSTMHRVLPPVTPDGRLIPRRSAAFFHDCDADAVIACLPSCTDADHPPLYPPTTVGEHIAAKLAGSRGGKLDAAAEAASREAARLTAAE